MIEGMPEQVCIQCCRRVLPMGWIGLVPTGFTLPFGDREIWELDDCEVQACPCIDTLHVQWLSFPPPPLPEGFLEDDDECPF